jgi:beta-phosphoglucomutase-like phosphatase (HAD superfamily)
MESKRRRVVVEDCRSAAAAGLEAEMTAARGEGRERREQKRERIRERESALEATER